MLKKVLKSSYRQLTAAALMIALVLGSAFTAAAAPAETDAVSSASIVERRNIRVGFFTSSGLIMECDENGANKRGYIYDYLQSIRSYTNWDYEYVYADSFAEQFDQLQRGEIDIMCDVSWTKEREEILLYPEEPLGEEIYRLYTISGSGIDESNYKTSLSGSKIAVRGGTLQSELTKKWLEETGISAEVLDIYEDEESTNALFETGEADALVELEFLAKDGWNPVTRVGASNFYVAFAKGNEIYLNEMNEARRLLDAADPYWQVNLYNKYFRQKTISRQLTEREQSWVNRHSEIVLGTYSQSVSYYEQAAPEIVADSLKQLGLQDKISITTRHFDVYADMLDALQKGEIQIAAPLISTGYFEDIDDYSIAGGVDNRIICEVERDGMSFENAKVIATIKGTYTEHYILSTVFDKEIITCENAAECFRAVSSGKADVAVMAKEAADKIIGGGTSGSGASGTAGAGIGSNNKRAGNAYDGLTIRQRGESIETGYGVNRDDAGLFMLLERAAALADNNYISDTLAKYKTVQAKYTTDDFVRENISMVFGIVLLIIILLTVALMLALVQKRKDKEYRTELSRALSETEKASRAKTNFLFNMSHDIRTPMNAIIGFTNLLERNGDDREKRAEYIKKIQTSNEYLLSLINNVLEMSRIESGKLVLDESVMDLEQFNESVFSVFGPEMAKKKLEFVKDIGLEHRFIMIDPTKLHEIALNIISNAVKYTPEGGTIRISMHEIEPTKPGHARYKTEISDTGIGMSEEFLPHIFDEFTRERTSTESKVQGTGLGMAITKKLVDLMGGEIFVESELGKGTTFTILLEHRIASEDEISRADKKAANYSGVSFAGKRILIAEDNELNAEIAIEILKDAGFELEWAEDGEACVEMLANADAGHFDLILMDVQMPRLNGYEATKRIREFEDLEKADIPIIAMTANAFAEDRQNAIEAGMNGHIAKPIDITKLMETLATVLK
ncbi:MAG: ATP-binding protein [Eubacteriales bacterium]|nr:ATP-binding protein [Eubacteriales bacterium]